MNRRAGRSFLALATAAALLAGCTPGPQNGDTVPIPAVVPAPASIEGVVGAPFRLTGDTRVKGDADASAALTALVSARTALELPSTSSGTEGEGSGTEGVVTLRVEPGGPAESYRLTADEASVTITGADAAGLFY